MIRTLDDVVRNEYLNHFEEIAKQFGLEGVYVKYQSSITKQEEIFFICGLDKEKVHSNSLDIDKLYCEQEKNYSYHNLDIGCFKITGNDPLIIHRMVLDYCQTTEFLLDLKKNYDISIPDKISNALVNFFKMSYKNATDPYIDLAVKGVYIDDIRTQAKKQSQLFSGPDTKRSKKLFHFYGHYDSQKSRFSNWIKRMFSKDKNRVSMEHLLTSCEGITTVGVHISDAPKVHSELRKRPDIIYWMADKPVGRKTNYPGDQGYGSAKANDRRYIAFSCDRECSRDFLGIVNRIECPDGYLFTADKLIAEYQYVQHISVLANDFKRYAEAFSERGIKYCINDVSTLPGVIELVVASNIEDNISNVLNAIRSEDESTHIFSSYQNKKTHPRAKQHEHQMKENVLEKAKKITGSGNLELVSSFGSLDNSNFLSLSSLTSSLNSSEQSDESKDDFYEDLPF